jgi:uncharacterized protein (DUF433 family)
MADSTAISSSLDEFFQRWEASGAAERANYSMFLNELCDLLCSSEPRPTGIVWRKGRRRFMATIQGVIHGKTIELERESGLPDGQRVAVELCPLDERPAWLERFVVDPTVMPGKFVIKGTRLQVDDLVQSAAEGRTDDELRQLHPDLTTADVEAVRNYARVPEGLRRSFGGWVDDADVLDKYLDWTRQQRKVRRPEVQE